MLDDVRRATADRATRHPVANLTAAAVPGEQAASVRRRARTRRRPRRTSTREVGIWRVDARRLAGDAGMPTATLRRSEDVSARASMRGRTHRHRDQLDDGAARSCLARADVPRRSASPRTSAALRSARSRCTCRSTIASVRTVRRSTGDVLTPSRGASPVAIAGSGRSTAARRERRASMSLYVAGDTVGTTRVDGRRSRGTVRESRS